MELTEFERFIKTRRSIRRWKPEPVKEEIILKAIEMATWAPNGGNQQNWGFVVVTNRDLIRAMADKVQTRMDSIASWPEAGAYAEDASRWKGAASLFREAPVCIGVGMSAYESVADKILRLRMDKDQEARAMFEARRSANAGLQSVAAATAYLVLALHAQGLGGLWMTGPLIAKKEVEEILGLQAPFTLASLVAAGLPDEDPIKTRRPVSEVVAFRR